MRSAARHLCRSRVSWLILAAAGCSIYEPTLLDDAAEITGGASSGASSSGSGRGGGGATVAGKSGGDDEGGSSGMVSAGTAGTGTSAEGGEAGEPSTGGGTGGSEPQAGTNAGGTSAGTNGSSGAGGGGAVGLIDGFEDDDLTLERTDGRGGVWYLFEDGTTGKVGPSPLACTPLSDAPSELGGYAMHITASGFTGWGSGLGVDFRAGKKPYDASAAQGIRFWARVGAGKNPRHRVQLVDVSTDKLGGKCNPAEDAPELEKCDDHFGKDLLLTSEWKQYVIPFTALEQLGFGLPATLDKQALYGLQLTAKAKLEVDLWIDQVEFF